MNRNVFEVLIERRNYDDSIVVGWRSHMFDASQYLELRHHYGREIDPRQLGAFMEEMVGRTLENFARLRVREGREMVQALLPHFEREIHLRMEQMEHEGRHRRAARYDYGAEILMRPDVFFGMDFVRASEDPKAKKKARALLVKNLDATQAAAFEKSGEFDVKAQDGKVYKIKTARSFNVVGPDGTKYCGQLADAPVEDQMLAQKLLLEHEPDKFFKNANVSPASGGTTAMEIQMRMMQQAEQIMSPEMMRQYMNQIIGT